MYDGVEDLGKVHRYLVCGNGEEGREGVTEIVTALQTHIAGVPEGPPWHGVYWASIANHSKPTAWAGVNLEGGHSMPGFAKG